MIGLAYDGSEVEYEERGMHETIESLMQSISGAFFQAFIDAVSKCMVCDAGDEPIGQEEDMTASSRPSFAYASASDDQ